jgi:hypothetical protein
VLKTASVAIDRKQQQQRERERRSISSLTFGTPPLSFSLSQGIEIEVKGRRVRVKGPRGSLHRDFRHLAVDMFLTEEEGEKILKVGRGRFGSRRQGGAAGRLR